MAEPHHDPAAAGTDTPLARPAPAGARHPHGSRSATQTAVDTARREHVAARDAVDACTASSPTEVREAAAAALTSSAAGLKTAVHALTEFNVQVGTQNAPRIDVDIAADGRTVVVRPHGALDLLTCPHLEQVTDAQLDDPAVEELILDMAQVSFLDSSALAVLVEVHHVAADNRTGFTVTGLTGRQRRLLEITRLDQILQVR